MASLTVSDTTRILRLVVETGENAMPNETKQEMRECPDCSTTGKGDFCDCSPRNLDPDCSHNSTCLRCNGEGFVPYSCEGCAETDMPARGMTCRACVEANLPASIYAIDAVIR